MTIVLILSLSSISLANNEGSKEAATHETGSLEVTAISTDSRIEAHEIAFDKENQAYNVQYILDTNQKGKSAFTNSFTSSTSNGTSLNITVNNNNPSGTVIFNVYRGEEDFGFVDVKAGQDITRSFAMIDDSGISGDWKVYVTTRDGHSMDINVHAGQLK